MLSINSLRVQPEVRAGLPPPPQSLAAADPGLPSAVSGTGGGMGMVTLFPGGFHCLFSVPGGGY